MGYIEKLVKNFASLAITVSIKKSALLCSLTLVIFLTLMLISTAHISYQVKDVEAITSQTINSTLLTRMIQQGNEMINISKYEDAVKSFDQVLTIHPGSVEALNGKGLALNKLGRYQEAITWFDKALKIQPTFINALNDKGVALANLNRFEEAITWFDKAIKINPNFVDALYNKGGALAELGKYDDSAKWTNKALEIDKTYQNTSNSKSLLLPND
ncbi:MAG TPA: tetratricopeptide repeat protein [Nitrososphaeraceae archaeon]